MTEDAFWELIEKVKKSSKGDFIKFCKKLTCFLIKHSVDEIISFENILNKKLKEATTYEMLLACFIINSYISDDTFEYFCAWLIGQGKQDFLLSVSDPNYLCKLLDKGDESNRDGIYLTSVGIEAFEKKTNRDDDEFYDRIEYPKEPEIKRLTKIDVNEYQDTLPLLFDKFWNQKEIDKLYKN